MQSSSGADIIDASENPRDTEEERELPASLPRAEACHDGDLLAVAGDESGGEGRPAV